MTSSQPELGVLRAEAATCTRCALFERATQTVFGEGGPSRLMLVGEQPGDVEDRAGRPFVGPAGLLLRELLSDAGIAIESAYVTNAVKHFKWRPAGKRRIHDKPNWTEIRACGDWLELELAAVRPEVVVCLGATAAQALLGKTARVGALRGRPHALSAATVALVTLHPSAVLRAGQRRDERRAELAADLALAAELLADQPAAD
jgi:DNA polymerase